MAKKTIHLKESDIRNLINESVNTMLKEAWDQAAYENACDDLYYGYGFDFWYKQHNYLSHKEAESIWQRAMQKMSGDKDHEISPKFKDTQIDADWGDLERTVKNAAKPNANGRYPHENTNVASAWNNGEGRPYRKGELSLMSQGTESKLNNMAARNTGSTPVSKNMGLADNAREHERLTKNPVNQSSSAKMAWKQGRLGNERPLHRKDSLNHDVPSANESIDRIVKEAINKVINEYNGYNRQQGSLDGMAKSYMDYDEPWEDNGKYNRHCRQAEKHNNLSNVTDPRSKGCSRAASSQDPLAVRQRMNQLGNNPQDTLKKSRQYRGLQIK